MSKCLKPIYCIYSLPKLSLQLLPKQSFQLSQKYLLKKTKKEQKNQNPLSQSHHLFHYDVLQEYKRDALCKEGKREKQMSYELWLMVKTAV